MSTFRLTLRCDNDAFQPRANDEVARILRQAADVIESGYDLRCQSSVRDANGNAVGHFILKGR